MARPFITVVILAAGLIWLPATTAWPQSAEHQHGQAATDNAPKHGHMMMGHGQMKHGPMKHGQMMGRHGRGAQAALQGHHQAGPIPHLEGRLAFLRVEIGITDGQLEAWNAFADAMRKANKLSAAPPDAERNATWRESLEQREKATAVRLEQLRTIRGAADTLFAVLTDNQKATADQLLNGPMGLLGLSGFAHGGGAAGPRRHM